MGGGIHCCLHYLDSCLHPTPVLHCHWWPLISPELDRVIIEICNKENVNEFLIKAFILTESNGNPWAVRFEPSWGYFVRLDEFSKLNMITRTTEMVLQATSWGPMQIMGSVSRELGFDGMLTKLIDPSISLRLSVIKLKQLMSKYTLLDDVIAAYNAGHPERKENGEYKNQDYVTKVKQFTKGLH